MPLLPRLPALSAFASLALTTSFVAAAEPIHYDWFLYEGADEVVPTSPSPETYLNPVFPGFYPDPSIVRVGEDYYVVNSSFAFFPGVPIFHSRDLKHWRQLGHVLDRPEQLDLDGHATSRGIYAPAIEYHDGLFYMVTTVVDTFGNFFVTAKDPAGPWSDPIRLPEVDGIDPSFFFDHDGRAWLVNNGPPPNNRPLYEGHRAIWIQEFDVAAQKLIGPRQIIINGGVDLSEKPVWIEGPHIYRHNDWYYLTCAEGGTAIDHHQVIFRSRDVLGPWEPWRENPILDQRGLSGDRPFAVSSVGHADLFTTPAGDWYAVFLGCRPFTSDFYNTGRETFMLPVEWTEEGWPRILAAGESVPREVAAPALPPHPFAPAESFPNGNFTWRDDFGGSQLRPEWVTLRTPREDFYALSAGTLALTPRRAPFQDLSTHPSFLGRRQQHLTFRAATALLPPTEVGVEAGLVAYLDETHHFFVGLRQGADGLEIFTRRMDGDAVETSQRSLLAHEGLVELLIGKQGDRYQLGFRAANGEEVVLVEEDARLLTIAHAWGFTGVMVGPYVTQE